MMWVVENTNFKITKGGRFSNFLEKLQTCGGLGVFLPLLCHFCVFLILSLETKGVGGRKKPVSQ